MIHYENPPGGPIAGIVLAAGESRRMGFPKPLLPYRGTTFLQHLIAVLQDQVDPLLVVLGHRAETIRPAAAGAEVLLNPDYRQGQLSSLQVAIRALQSRPEIIGAMVALVDHPCIDTPVVKQLLASFREHRPFITIPLFQGRRGHPMIFARELFQELLDSPLHQGARLVVRGNRSTTIEIGVDDEGVLNDLDDPETYERITGIKAPTE